MENDANPNPALIQSMDHNVIQNIKLGYRKLLLKTILNDPLHNENLEKTQTNGSDRPCAWCRRGVGGSFAAMFVLSALARAVCPSIVH
ncbi:hypothetical protein AVEN_62493-1 [Araneus ventricosus]|uniref:Uncharacterized protein n=1 Tax=Araneus ventricosus TaxID=182803 RepID=A0A4Y2RZ96_ARAVE|nr:hypothetical protein AVEN_248942-1 [Araneus ventricosus]GBN80325.1 hypothetical protein AVEN_62493-1 [Araneus ventricosus]